MCVTVHRHLVEYVLDHADEGQKAKRLSHSKALCCWRSDLVSEFSEIMFVMLFSLLTFYY